MSPEKLFDYLEGNLPEAERAQLEQQLASDPQLQRELAIAREMHKRSRGSREVLGESDDQEIPSPESGKLGRRVAALLLMFAGAAAGMLLLRHGLVLPLVVSGVCVLTASAYASVIALSEPSPGAR